MAVLLAEIQELLFHTLPLFKVDSTFYICKYMYTATLQGMKSQHRLFCLAFNFMYLIKSHSYAVYLVHKLTAVDAEASMVTFCKSSTGLMEFLNLYAMHFAHCPTPLMAQLALEAI